MKGDSRFRLGIPNEESDEVEECSTTPEEKIRTIVTYLLTVDPTPSWRRMISSLDQIGDDKAFASKLYEYAEPITGEYSNRHALDVKGGKMVSSKPEVGTI